MFAYVCVCVYVCMYVCMYVCIYIYIYIYIYKYKDKPIRQCLSAVVRLGFQLVFRILGVFGLAAVFS